METEAAADNGDDQLDGADGEGGAGAGSAAVAVTVGAAPPVEEVDGGGGGGGEEEQAPGDDVALPEPSDTGEEPFAAAMEE
jgi:hypothetical protein